MLEVGFGSSGVNIDKGYYPRGVTVVGLDPLLATYPPITPQMSDYSATTTTATQSAVVSTTTTATQSAVVSTTTTSATTTSIVDAERVYHQQAATAQADHGVHLAGLVQGKAEELPFADASFDAVGECFSFH